MIYSSADASSPHVMMMEVIAQISQMTIDLKVPVGNFHCEDKLSWDSHTICNKLAFDPHSTTFTGYAEDVLNLDVSLEQLKKIRTEEDKSNGTGECNHIYDYIYMYVFKAHNIILWLATLKDKLPS